MVVPGPVPRLAAGLIAAGTLVLAGCGGSDEESSAGQPAPDPASFPSTDGRTLQQLLSEEASAEGPVISPAGQVFEKGDNRYPFGVFTVGGEQIEDAEIAIYAAHGPNGQAKGPYPARVESLEVDPAYESKTTADDPDAAHVVYVTDVEFDADGEWRIGALVRSGDALQGSLAPSAVVERFSGIPELGDKAPSVHTPTADQVSDIAQIDTRDPPSTMHDQDLADVLGKQPVVLVFATPQLCQSRVCGPVVDVTEQVKAEHGDDVAFIHQEIYEDNAIDKGLRPQVKAYGLPTEPWAFVIDEDGRVQESLEGAFSAAELEQAVQQVSG